MMPNREKQTVKKEVKEMNREEVAKNGISKQEMEEIQKEMHYQLSIELNQWRFHQQKSRY